MQMQQLLFTGAQLGKLRSGNAEEKKWSRIGKDGLSRKASNHANWSSHTARNDLTRSEPATMRARCVPHTCMTIWSVPEASSPMYGFAQ